MFELFMVAMMAQRLFELKIAKKNEQWMKEQGAIEFGRNHYPYIVGMHVLFFIVLILEMVFFQRGIPDVWPWLFALFGCTQLIRLWAILSLGKYWNTKIIVLPNVQMIKQGPYRYIKHPNYLVVSLEIVIVPLLFGAYFTAGLFSILNILMLSIRIPAEEKALKELTEYEVRFAGINRFLPKLLNKYDN